MAAVATVLALVASVSAQFTISLKYTHGGACFNSYCDTGWYSSPAVVQVGSEWITIGGQYRVSAVTSNGTLKWQVPAPASGNARVWADIAIAQVDGSGDPDVVVAWHNSYVGVLNINTGAVLSSFNGGQLKQVSTGSPTSEFRGLAVRDLTGDGKAELLVGLARSNVVNAWLLDYTGATMSGWPNLATEEQGYAWGVYSNNVAIVNLDADSTLELVVPSDKHYISAYKANGVGMGVSSTEGWKAKTASGATPPKWGHIALMSDYALEIDSSNNCDLGGYSNGRNPTRTNCADAPIVWADIDGDGVVEGVVVGRSYEWCAGCEVTRHNGVYILNKDRTRFRSSRYPIIDWREVPQPKALNNTNQPCCQKMGDRLASDCSVIQSANNAPVVADLDGDGVLEILYSSYDGRVHCWWADKTEKWNWPVTVGTASSLRYASPPVVADLDGDGYAEVIFSTWTAISGVPASCTSTTCEWGSIKIYNYKGELLTSQSIPQPKPCAFNPGTCSDRWNGIMGSLTLADVDGNGLLDILGVSANSGIVRFEVAGTTGFRLYWPTGRGTMSRHGEAPASVRLPSAVHTSVLGNGDYGHVTAPTAPTSPTPFAPSPPSTPFPSAPTSSMPPSDSASSDASFLALPVFSLLLCVLGV